MTVTSWKIWVPTSAVIIAALIEVLGPRVSSIFDDSFLELLDVSVKETSRNQCELDFKLHNGGRRTGYVTRAEFQVPQTWPLAIGVEQTEYIAPSANYKVTLPASGAPYTLPQDLSQSVEPDHVDRFVVTVGGSDWKQSGTEFIFAVKVALIYGGGRKSVTSRTLLFSSRGDLANLKYAEPPTESDIAKEQNPATLRFFEQLKESSEANRRMVADIERIDGIRSARVEKVIEFFKGQSRLAPDPVK